MGSQTVAAFSRPYLADDLVEDRDDARLKACHCLGHARAVGGPEHRGGSQINDGLVERIRQSHFILLNAHGTG